MAYTPFRLIAAVLALGVAVFFAYFAYNFVLFPAYVDHGVPIVIIRSWMFANGAPLYQLPASDSYLLVPYGPIIFLVNAAYLALFGGSLVVSKLAGVVSAGLAAVVFTAYVWREFGRPWAALGTVLFLCLTMYSVPFSVWSRPDPQAILLVSLALLATTFGRDDTNRILTAVAIGVLAGVAANLKVHFVIFFVPLVFRFCGARWMLTFPTIIASSLVVMLIPFAFSGISLGAYLDGVVNIVGVRPILIGYLFENFKRSLVYLSPCLAVLPVVILRFRTLPWPDLLYFGVLAACILVSYYPSMVAGSGWYQMNPFFPVSIDVALRFLRHLEAHKKSPLVLRSALVTVFLIGFAILAVTPQKRQLRMYHEKTWMAEVAREMLAIEAELQPDKLQMGYGVSITEEAYRLTWLKPLLAFRGHPVTIDAWSDGEAKFSKVPVAPFKIDHLAACTTKYWLIPKPIPFRVPAEKPFSMQSFLGGTVFWPELIDTFYWNYGKIRSYEYFDLWACNPVG